MLLGPFKSLSEKLDWLIEVFDQPVRDTQVVIRGKDILIVCELQVLLMEL